MTLKIGSKLKGNSFQYVIERVLGQGSFGVTYKARGYSKVKGAFGEMEVELPEPIAIKEFFMREVNQRDADGSISGLSEGSLAYNYARKFRKEAERLAIMQHPNIVKVMDFVEANNTFYYVMEFIDGEDVSHYMKSHPLQEDEAVSIITDVAHALQYMHEQHKMLHLDLKPGNIMRRKSDGHVFLIDFGLSKHYSDDGQPDTSTTIGLGTEGYAPIEQGKRASSNHSFRPTIDVYALGGTLFKMLTGETPPAASDILEDDGLLGEIMGKHAVNSKLQNIIIKAMKPSAKQRTQSVAEFLKNLEQLSEEDSLEEDLIPDDVVSVEAPISIEKQEEETVVVTAIPAQVKPTIPKSNVNVKPPVQPKVTHSVQPVKSQVVDSNKNGSKKKWIVGGACAAALVFGMILLIPKQTDSTDIDSPENIEAMKAALQPDTVKNMAFKNEELLAKLQGSKNSKDKDLKLLAEYVYTGPVNKDGKPNGIGEAIFTPDGKPDGRSYRGPFRNGNLTGDSEAVYIFTNGDVFKGTFKNNVFEKGTITLAESGESFQGTFKDGQPSVGTWYRKDGKKLQDVK